MTNDIVNMGVQILFKIMMFFSLDIYSDVPEVGMLGRMVVQFFFLMSEGLILVSIVSIPVYMLGT